MNDLKPFDQLISDVSSFVKPVSEVKVLDPSSCDKATLTLKEIKFYEKKIEEKRKELVGPLNDQVSKINEYAKEIKGPLANAEAHVKRELLAWERVLEKQREEQRQAERAEQLKREAEAQALIDKQKEDAAAEALFADYSDAEEIQAKAQAEAVRIEFEAKKAHWDASKEIAQNKVSGATKRWVFSVENPALFPREYLILDDKKVREAIRAGVREIPGLVIYQETSISVR